MEGASYCSVMVIVMSKEYCYKIKHTYIKVKKNNAYAKPKIEAFGFMPMQEVYKDENGNEAQFWAEGWAKTVKIDRKSIVAKWIKNNIENIYKQEKEKEDSKWLTDIVESGYEFDDEGKLVENEKYLSGLEGQLCIMATGEYKGTLFINMGGAIEFYDSKTLLSSCFEEVIKLQKAEVIYKKRFKA